MSLKYHFEMLATYNQLKNAKVYAAASRLSAIELDRDRGAFFGSIQGMLNHLMVGDTIWLKRFATHPSSSSALHAVADLPSPIGLGQNFFNDISCLAKHRVWLDQQIVNWVTQLSRRDLDSFLSYYSTQGVPSQKQYSSLILHFFNYQTHHRGRVSAVLSQAGEHIEMTGLLALIPQEAYV